MDHKETIYNFIWRSVQIFGKQGVTFLIFVLCAKFLTPHDFGIYNYILVVIYFLVIFGDFGISTATSRYVAEYQTTNKKKLRNILFNSILIIIGLGFTVTLLTILFGGYLFKEQYIYVMYALPMLFFSPISSLYDGIFRGLKRFKELALISLSISLLSLVFVYFLVKNFGLAGALISQSIYYFLLVVVSFIIYGNLYFEIDKELIKTIVRYSTLIGISSLGYFLYSRVDIIVLEYYGYIEEIGYYEVVNKVFQLMFTPFALLAQVVAPDITAYFARNEYKKIHLKFMFFMKLILPISVLIAIGFYFIFPLIVKFFAPKYYVAEMLIAISILSLLIPAKIWGVFQTQCFIVATGFAKIVMITTIIGGVINVILDIVFINWIGFTGVFWVTLMVHTFNIVFQTVYYSKKIWCLE